MHGDEWMNTIIHGDEWMNTIIQGDEWMDIHSARLQFSSLTPITVRNKETKFEKK